MLTGEVPYRPLPVDQSGVRYAHGPDSHLRDEVPPGRTLEFTWDTSTVHPGTRRKPLRILLGAGHRDIGWNQPYDMRLVVGDGGHDPNHGGVLLPDALRWVWRAGASASASAPSSG